jgi:TRAP-type C4-dicarboxylate transport system substrate-binding protein
MRDIPTMNRRTFLAGAMGAGALLAAPNIARAQTFLTRIWDTVREETNGRLDVTVHPRNNDVAIGEPDLLKSLQAGELEFFVLNGNILSAAHPAADIQGIPFAFADAEQATALWDGELGNYLAEELAPTGVRLIPFGVLAASDLEGYMMRVPGGELFVDFYRALGAEPQVINFNRLGDALREGTIDGFENPLVVIEENRFYETCHYISLTNHQWAGFNMIASESFWRMLPEELRDAVIRNAQRFVPEQRAYVRAANDGYENVLRMRGLEFSTPDLQSFRDRLREADFYVRWRERTGERAWAMMEAAVGPVG